MIAIMDERSGVHGDVEGKADDTSISELRSETGFELPPELEVLTRRFGWLHFGEDTLGAIARYDDGLRSFEVQHPLKPIESMSYDYAAFVTEDGPEPRLPRTHIPFGTANGGNDHLLMNGADHSDTTVYFWRRVDEPWGEGENDRGFGVVAPTLHDFFLSLRPLDEL